jgi:hypothetical protein
MTAAQASSSCERPQGRQRTRSEALVADLTGRGKVRNLGTAAPARLSRKSTRGTRPPSGSYVS